MAATWWSRRFVEVLESYGLGTRMQRGRRYARTGQVLTPRRQRGDGRVALFPRTWKELRARCSCPDWENPCKHIAAVLYVFADQLETDPWLLLAWRGRTREEILDPLRGSAGFDAAADDVAAWWPFNGPTMPHPGDLPPPASDVQPADPARPDAVLDGLEVLNVTVAGVAFRDAVRLAYDRLIAADTTELHAPGSFPAAGLAVACQWRCGPSGSRFSRRRPPGGPG